MFDFAGKRWWYLSVSLVVVLAALIVLAIPPTLRAGIEFTSGSSFTLRFENEVSTAEIRTALAELDHPEARVQETAENEFLIRTSVLEGAPALDQGETGPVPPGEIDVIESGLEERFGPFERLDFATVSGTVSSEIAFYAFLAVVGSAVAIFIYLFFAFRRVPAPGRYGVAAVAALTHDAVIVLGLFSLLGKINGTEVDTAFLVALLTIIGFSVHDTIVVFDRIRETVFQDPYIPFKEAVNASLTETLPRSLNTSITFLLAVFALYLIGGDTIRDFLLVLIVGGIAGVYSSIGVAAQILVLWEDGDLGRAWRRVSGRGDPAPTESGVEPAS